MGAAAAARAMAPNGGIADELYRNSSAKRKAEREAALAAAIYKDKQSNQLVRAAVIAPASVEERQAWEARSIRAQRAKDAQLKQSKARAPKRESKPAPRASKLYAQSMSCDAARDPRLPPKALNCLVMIHAAEQAGLPRPSKAWMADQMSTSTKTIQRALSALRKFGYIATELVTTCSGWIIGQSIRITDIVKPFFLRKGFKKKRQNREFWEGTRSSPKKIPMVSDSTNGTSQEEEFGALMAALQGI